MLIDAHCHVWRIGRNDHEWPTPDLPAIHRDFDLDDLVRVGAEVGLTGAVLVQSQPSQRDTEWLLEIAADHPLALGVVGWTDIASADAAERIAALAANPCLKGLRPMLQDLADDWVLEARLEPALAAMVAADLSFDALVRPRHLPSLLELVRRWPDLRVVIDHGAKPDIGAGRLDPWREQITALAAAPGVHCKLSGLLTEAGETPTAEALAPFVAHLLEAFGADRLMWGSDWPVLNLAGDYRGWQAMADAFAAPLDPTGRRALFGETAKRFYRL